MNSNVPQFTIRELLEVGAHYGHRSMRWNPKMKPYLYGVRNGSHVIDLQQTATLMREALNYIYKVVSNNGRILFVGTKRQVSVAAEEEANRCGQYYVNHRWLGGMLTNWSTVSKSINTLNRLEEQLSGDLVGLKKKEILSLSRRLERLKSYIGGIVHMGGKPDLLFVIDTNKEALAIKEAKKLNIPVVAILDSNSDPTDIDFPIPGNDDAIRSIRLYCKLVADTVLAGLSNSMQASSAESKEKADGNSPKETKEKIKKNNDKE